MECDVIPDCTQEVDPLGNLDNCDPLSDESCSYGGALNAQIISSNHSSFIIHPSTPQHIQIHTPTTDRITKKSPITQTIQTDDTKSTKHNHGLRKMLPRPNSKSAAQSTSTAASASSILSSPTSTTSVAGITINNTTTQASTMREVLASIPGFCIKPRRRSNKKLSTAAQLQQTRDEGLIDLETPDSILTATNLRDLLNRQTFSLLPPLYQYKLIQLLPTVDRPVIDSESPTIRLNSSSLNNEFFARACLEWRDRLDEGEFTPENQLKLRAEAEKEKIKLDPWKLKHFEPIWGDNGQSTSQKLANQINEAKKQQQQQQQQQQQKQQQLQTVAKQTAATSTIVETITTVTTAAEALPVETTTKVCVPPLVSSCSDASEIISETSINNPPSSLTSTSELSPLITTQITTIATTTSATSSLSPSSNSNTSYTTSSGRLIKSPNSYSSLTYSQQQQKRQRTVGAVTRSSASTSTTVVAPQQPQATQPPPPPQPSESPTKISNPVPDLLPLRSKPVRLSNSNLSPEHSTASTSSSTSSTSVCKDIDTVDYSSHPPADISIIETTGTAESIAATRAPTYSDIKPNVEIISLGCVDPSSISAHQSPKRSLKRSVSPSDAKTNTGNDTKISKYTHHEHNSSKLMQQCAASSVIEVIKIERPMPSPHKLTTTILPPLTISSVVSDSYPALSSITTSTTTTMKTIEVTTSSPAPKPPQQQPQQQLSKLLSITPIPKETSENIDIILTSDFLSENSNIVAADVDEKICETIDERKMETITESTSIVLSESQQLSSLMQQTHNQNTQQHPKQQQQQTPTTKDDSAEKLEIENDKIDEPINIYDDELYNKLHLDTTPASNTDLDTTINHQHHTTNSGDSGASTSSTIGVNAIASDDQNIDTPPSLRMSGECSEYSNDPNSLSGGATTLENHPIDESKFDSNFTSNETDSLTNFCTDDIKLENIYKIQNFEGVLQIQPNSLTLVEQDRHVVSMQRGDGLMCNSVNVGGGDDSSNSTTALADCSGENSADTAVEELEPSIQNLEPIEDDPIEQKFTDAENYVLESGEISRDSGEANSLPVDSKLCSTEDDIQAKMFAAAMARAFDSVPGNIPVAMTVVNPTENTEVIPMQETLEVRLKESTYQVVSDWPPSFNIKTEKMTNDQSADDFNSAGNTSTSSGSTLPQNQQQNHAKMLHQSQQQHPIYSTASQVKLELEVTLTPEPEVSSTVVSNNSTNSCDSDQSSSNEDAQLKSSSSSSSMNIMPTVIPPTTIVCLPSNSVSLNNIATMHGATYMTTQNSATVVLPPTVQKQFVQQQQQQNVFTGSANQQQQQQQQSQQQQSQQHRVSIQQPRTAVVASSSSIPYLSIATTQPLRAVPNTPQNRPKLQQQQQQQKSGRGRSNNNRPPPGAVNLERSYQICQAVIQNSPNRHQLKGQLRPPPSMIGSTAGAQQTANKKDEPNVVKIQSNGQPRVTFSKKGFVQRQPSPVLVRHVFTTNQGIPVSMAVLPSGVHQTQQQQLQQQLQQQSSGTNSNDSSNSGQLNPSGQYILVQRAGIVPNDNQAPRASSAPPAQNQQTQSVTGIPITGRGRPASVDNDNAPGQDSHQYIETTPNIQTITRKVPNQGFVYGDISMETTYPHYTISGENTPPNCACSLNAMVICQQCGVFCHDECMGSSKLCLSCVIR